MLKPRNKAFLVILQTHQREENFLDESYREMKELTESALIQVAGTLRAKVHHPSPSHFVREGKLAEIHAQAKTAGANVLIFNVDLSPGQARNIEAVTKIPPMDRTGVILDIFGRRAKSKEGKMQVELARLNYILPRLGGLGGVMSRLGGGIGTRGPGEQELEHDRRKIRRRIQLVKEELKKVHQHRALIRSGRKRRRLITVALVGYTNAGKSTLMNALTGAETYVEDKMFATLDPKSKLHTIQGYKNILFIDTVGFLKDLPHTLVESFHATLEEVIEADVLIHVLDVSHSKAVEQFGSVQKVLEEMKAGAKPILLALNKSDVAHETQRAIAEQTWSQGVFISAKQKTGLRELELRLTEILRLQGFELTETHPEYSDPANSKTE